ncbi:DNA replication protein DnaC [Enterococcus sp. PF1-24]|uniref:ATP-binding protein n=1 Tax=unclassified Enterococcus TaxID=2608891 RepID=UPI0024747B22|nr:MULTISPECIES: ATP-binding protein [unclassified Enterococcus]MDH6364698.1 DNA replication protein DnaC [Enterococcus sp. PFB1-1]MDH6401826.1 DNA replication protein DnaC [Enterococcus sp. PF1-24]
MNLLDGLPKEVANSLIEKSHGILETDEFCELHPRYKKMLRPDGETVCPVCYRERRDKIVANEKSKEYYTNTVDGKRQYLYEESIVSNKLIFDKGLKEFEERSDLEKGLKEKSKRLIQPLASLEPVTVYLQGNAGTGKSHLAMAMLKNANQLSKGNRCLFVNFPTLQQRIRASYDNKYAEDSESVYINKMVGASILVLDDIANEVNPSNLQGRVSDFSARILYAVMEARAESKPTIITSNIAWEELQKLLDPRVVSRMSHRLTLISFDKVSDKRKGK